MDLQTVLTAQGIEDGYLDLLMEMYQDQTGAVPGSEKFSIQRGVRQGDVLSPLLFNAVLEDAIRKWNLKLTNEGLRLGQDTRLTNLRYADDIMIFATSREELVSMVEMLVQELSLIGLQLNGTKTKVLTTSTLQETSYVEICGTMVAILHGGMTHKYLGRKFPGNLNSRTEVEIMHRIQCAWHKFHQHKLILYDIVEQTRFSQTAVEIISCNCFSDSNVWFVFTGAHAKTFAQIGRGTTADGEVYCWLGSHT